MKKSTKLFFATILYALFYSVQLLAQVPIANFTVTPTTRCANSILQITDLSTNSPTAWSYTMTGGTPANSFVKNPTVTYAATGTKTIVLIASNGSGSSAPVTKTINILPSPNFSVTPTSQTMCVGAGSVTFNAFAFSFPAPTYSWSTGATTNSISVSPSVTSIYTVVATGTNGCTAQRTSTAIVNPLPTVTITANPASICSGGNSTLIATATGPSPWTYTWSTAANTSSISTNIAGVYSATVANANGCRGILSYTLASGTTPTVTTVASASVLCAGQSATLTSSGATTYTYNPGGITGNPIVVSPTINTTYTVTGADSNNCSNTGVLTLSVSACTGVQQLISQTSLINVFPNPNNGEFTITVNSISENMNISIYNNIGQLINNIVVKEVKNKINLSKEPDGVYHINITEHGKSLFKTNILKL